MKNNMNIVRTKDLSSCSRHGFLIALCGFLFAVTSLNAQEKTAATRLEGTISVTGQIRDAHTKKPVAAAQIQALNKAASATTDENGNFTIKLFKDDDVLSVTAYDYAVREYPVRGNNSVVIDLFPDVFNSYYTKQDNLIGSIRNSCLVPSSKTVSDFTLSQAYSADEYVQSALGGNIRSISRSGIAAMGSSLFIRGYNSLNANAQPLFIVDGVIWNNLYDVESLFDGHFMNSLANIDINDIENITVLKDGTSLYGSKASNGIIMIKTNRGKNQVTKINLNIMRGSVSTPNSIPVMNSDQHRIYVSDMINSAGITTKEIAKLGYLQSDPTSSIYNKYHNNTNWADQVYQTGSTQSYNINVNGGDEKALYYFSLGYTGNEGIVKSTDIARINTRFNADINLLDNMTFGLNVSYTNLKSTQVDDGANFYTSPTYLSMIKSPFLSPFKFTSSGVATLDYDDDDELGIGNPPALIENSMNYTRQHYFDISCLPTYWFNKNLSLSSQFDYTLSKIEENYFRPMLGVVPQVLEGFGISLNEIRNQWIRNISIFDDTRLKYSNLFDGGHKLDVTLGWRYLNNYFESDYIEAHNTGTDNNTQLIKSYSYRQNIGINNLTKSISNYAAVDYNFENKYFLSAAVSLDGSSRFGENAVEGLLGNNWRFFEGWRQSLKRDFPGLFNYGWGAFPSLNGAWLVSSEKFMQNVEFVNLLKLRAGYGITGNDGIEDYASRAYFSTVRYLGFANGIVMSNISNDKLQWETTGRANAGIDLGLFNERLNLSLDVYTSKTKNLLTMKSLEDLVGIDSYWLNSGELSNKGFEFSANIKLLNLKKIQWEISLSAGHYKNRIESLPEGEFVTSAYKGSILSRVGQSAGVFYGYKTKGVFATQEAANTANLAIVNINGSYSYYGAGDIYFEDFKPDNIIDENDKQIIGDPNPDIYGSFSSKLTIMKFTLNALFNYSYGNEVYNYLRSQLEAGKDMSNQTTAMLSRWTTEDQKTNQPKATFGDPMGNARFSDRWIEDGSYLRLKTLSLSYRIPINSSFISGLDLWVAANNLLTVTNYLGVDPEFSTRNSVLYQGIDAGLVPQTRSYFMGVKINL